MHVVSPSLPRVCPPRVLAGLLLSLACVAQAQTDAADARAGAVARGAPVTLNFVNADIESVARAMASMTGRQVVVDPRVKGTISLNSDKPLAPTAAYDQFLAALRLQGYTVVESAGLDKVVPEAEAKLQSTTVSAGSASGNQVVTHIFKLNFESASNLLPVLRPLISPNNVINVNASNNTLIVTDYVDNLRRIARIIAASDVSNASDIEIINLKHAIAGDLAPLVLRLVEGSAATLGAPAASAEASFKTTIIAEPRSNSLIVRAANPARVELVKSLVSRLDQPSVQGDSGSGNIHVIYLKNADANKLAATLRAVLSGEQRALSSATPLSGSSLSNAASNASSGGGASTSASVSVSGGGASNATLSGPGQIQADAATNSLIVTASDPQFRQLSAVIEQLDARRAQVYIESLIAEVDATRAAQFGVQWQGPLGSTGAGTIGLLGTNFGSGGSNIIGLATGVASGTVSTPSAGLNVGAATQVNGTYTLSLLANFLEQNGDSNVLSTPNLLTLDNEEAKIVVGQNVPFVTGQYANTTTSNTVGTVNPFQTIERKDVGITLKVRPQISENGTVRLAIYQEVSSVDPTSVNSSTGLVTNKRSIESNVLVQDGQIVVLGGLLSDTFAANTSRVPGLADIPLLGYLFKSDSRSRQKTNLMVFLRPVVLRDGASIDTLAQPHYERMRAAEQGMQPTPSDLMPINDAAILPALDATKEPPAAAPVVVPAPASPKSNP